MGESRGGRSTPLPTYARLLVGAGFASALMIVLWFRQRATRNAGIVDVGWAGAIGLLGVVFAALGDGYGPRRLIVGAMVAVWSLRLTTYLHRRVHGEPEDGRYAKLRADWGESFERRILGFYQMQAAAVLLFAAPVLVASNNPAPGLRALDALGVALWVVGIAGLSIADAQLARFRRRPESRGKTCREGLWGLSRHPNYFFEWVLWWSYAPLAFGAPGWWVAALVPLILLYFLLSVTGIPVTEANALQSRGDDYREYQRTVSAFVPWFPKRASAGASHAAPH